MVCCMSSPFSEFGFELTVEATVLSVYFAALAADFLIKYGDFAAIPAPDATAIPTPSLDVLTIWVQLTHRV